MSSCPELGNISRTRRTVIEMGLEPAYGQQATVLRGLPIYENLNPFAAEIETITRTEASNILKPNKTKVFNGISRLNFLTYIYGSGDPDNTPPWMDLLEICGFIKDGSQSNANQTVYSPKGQKSATINSYLDSFKHPSKGCRGTFSISADAGKIVPITWSILGLYEDPDDETNPTDLVVNPGIPPLLCDANFSLITGGTTIIPVLKSFNVVFNVDYGVKKPSNKYGKNEKVVFSSIFACDWQCVIEVDKNYNFFKYFRDEAEFKLSATIGQNTGERVKIYTPEGNFAMLSNSPDYSDDKGIRTYTLNFSLTGKKFLEFMHF